MPIDEQQPVVLIAEDDENHAAIFRRAFEQTAFSGALQFVSDGEQAIAYLAGEGRFAARDEFPLPDFLLLDLKMPRKNGFDVLEWIRAQPSLAQLRTVVLTTSDDVREVNRAYQLGAASFLVKPVDFTEFRDTLQALSNYWLALNRNAPVARAAKPAAVETVAAYIRAQHNLRALHTQSVIVSLLGPQHTSWHYDVHVFNLIGHPTARQCFGWVGPDGQPVTVLASARITSPEGAVRSVYEPRAAQ